MFELNQSVRQQNVKSRKQEKEKLNKLNQVILSTRNQTYALYMPPSLK